MYVTKTNIPGKYTTKWLFTKINFYRPNVNWHIGQRKRFTIDKLFLIQPFLKPKFDCIKMICFEIKICTLTWKTFRPLCAMNGRPFRHSFLKKGPFTNQPQRRFTTQTLLNKKRRQGGGGQKLPILRRHSLWTAPQCYMQGDMCMLYLSLDMQM